MKLPRWTIKFLDLLTQAAAMIAAAFCAVCALAPWGQATIFRRVDLHIPGAVYLDGEIALGACLLAIVFRRSRLVGIAAAIGVLLAGHDAAIVVPRLIKSHLISAQMSLFQVNSLLNQAHLPDITIGEYGLPDTAYLDYGLKWLSTAALWLLGASLAGLVFDPLVRILWRRFGVIRCRTCRERFAVRRQADYCPHCGAWQHRSVAPRRCPACRSMLGLTDSYCACCGASAGAG